jgi:sugar phosphate isomerase/epimerase
MVRNEIGLSMLYCLSEPFKKMVKRIPETRITHIELVDDGLHSLNRQRVEVLEDLQRSYNLNYSIHAPFAGVNIAVPSRLLLNAAMKRLKQSIIHAAELESHLWVFHPGMKTGISMFYPGEDWTRNVKSIKLLQDFAADHGVTVGIENALDVFVMRKLEDFARFYSKVDDDIGLVFDTGHANIYGEVESFPKELSDRIIQVHAHDNDGKTDLHLGIGNGTIDWTKVASLLKTTRRDKVIVVESVEHVEQSVQKLKQLFA